MSWGYIKLGRLDLRETDKAANSVNAGTNENTVQISGTELTPPTPRAQLPMKREDFLGMIDRLIPVTFSQKTDLTGYYYVNDCNTSVTDWYATDGVAAFTWELILSRIGPSNVVDLESRLTGVVRQNAFALTGVRWHAPPVGHFGYFTGSTLPAGSVSRVGLDGTVKVWTGLPASVDPRWGCDPTDYIRGRVRLVQGGLERAGEGITLTASGWELSNTLVRVAPSTSTGLLNIDAWDTGVWAAKLWNISLGGVNLAPADIKAVTVLRNDLECMTIRLLTLKTGAGRTLIDITLRRGARFAEFFIQTDTSTTLTLHLQTAEASTDNSASGYVFKTADDTDGNRYTAGSAKAFTLHANGGVSKAATTTLDAFAGVALNGGTAAAGDAAVDLRDQYIAAPIEVVAGVLR